MQSPGRANDGRVWVSTPVRGSFSFFLHAQCAKVHLEALEELQLWNVCAAPGQLYLLLALLGVCCLSAFLVFEMGSGRGCSSSICRWHGAPCPMDRTHSSPWKWQLCTVNVVLKCFTILEPPGLVRPVRGKLQYDVTCSLVSLLSGCYNKFSEAFLLLFSLLHRCHMTVNCGHADAACILLPIYYLPAM